MQDKIKIGISPCLLGERVRYDGGHALKPLITETLSRYFAYVPACPEVGCGLPVPREPMRLEGDADAPRLVTVNTGVDMTAKMLTWAGMRVVQFENEGLCGFIFKSKSPSCGMKGVEVYDASGVPSRTGVGMFARAFMERFPLTPVEDELRLWDWKTCEEFIEKAYALNGRRGPL